MTTLFLLTLDKGTSLAHYLSDDTPRAFHIACIVVGANNEELNLNMNMVIGTITNYEFVGWENVLYNTGDIHFLDFLAISFANIR